MAEFFANVRIDPWQFADSMDYNHDRIINYIMAVDIHVGEMGFTEKLYARLGDAIRKELEEDA